MCISFAATVWLCGPKGSSYQASHERVWSSVNFFIDHPPPRTIIEGTMWHSLEDKFRI